MHGDSPGNVACCFWDVSVAEIRVVFQIGGQSMASKTSSRPKWRLERRNFDILWVWTGAELATEGGSHESRDEQRVLSFDRTSSGHSGSLTPRTRSKHVSPPWTGGRTGFPRIGYAFGRWTLRLCRV